jgi:hypothetical protein
VAAIRIEMPCVVTADLLLGFEQMPKVGRQFHLRGDGRFGLSK